MKLLQISTLWLALFLVMGAGCGEQKQKSKERGQAIVDTVKDADKNINDAVLKMQENLPQLEEEEEDGRGVLQEFFQTHKGLRSWQGS